LGGLLGGVGGTVDGLLGGLTGAEISLLGGTNFSSLVRRTTCLQS